MKKFRTFLAVAFSVGILSSCSTIYPVTATNNAIGSKVGKSETSILFGGASSQNLGYGLVFNKDYGVVNAVETGNIDRVATVDIKVTDYIIFVKAEIIVTGE